VYFRSLGPAHLGCLVNIERAIEDYIDHETVFQTSHVPSKLSNVGRSDQLQRHSYSLVYRRAREIV
jgi:hypothetical protein